MFPVPVAMSRQCCAVDKSGETDLNTRGSVYFVSHYFVTLIAIAVINALVLSGHLSGVVGAYINLGIGGVSFITNIAQIGSDSKERKFYALCVIQAIASLAIAASGLTFLNLLSMKTAAIMALGGIALPTAATCIILGKEKQSSSSTQAPVSNENGLSTSSASAPSTVSISQNKASVASSVTSQPIPSVNWSNFKDVKDNGPMNPIPYIKFMNPMTYIELYIPDGKRWAYGLKNGSNQHMRSESVANRAELAPYKAWLGSQGYSQFYPSA